MSNNENEIIKEDIFEDLLERGYTEDQIIKHKMVEDLFYRDKSLQDVLKEVKPSNPAYSLQRGAV